MRTGLRMFFPKGLEGRSRSNISGFRRCMLVVLCCLAPLRGDATLALHSRALHLSPAQFPVMTLVGALENEVMLHSTFVAESSVLGDHHNGCVYMIII